MMYRIDLGFDPNLLKPLQEGSDFLSRRVDLKAV